MAQRKSILIIDDERDYVDVLRDRLEFEGYDAHGAYDGASGLELFARLRPSVLILDVMMPGIDGFEFVRRLTAQGQRDDVLIVFVTAYGRKHTEEESTLMGDSPVLKKPVEMSDLIDIIDGRNFL